MTRRAFTLVELVVAVGVIVLLVGLTFAVSVAVIERAEREQTMQAMRLLDQAVLEWNLAAGRTLRWWDVHDDPATKGGADIHATTPPVLIITELLGVITRTASARDIVAQIDPELVHVYRDTVTAPWLEPPEQEEAADRFVGGLTVLDAWGTPIYATHPGRAWGPTDPYGPDPDGTIRTYNELEYGTAPNRQVVFVSAGPDGRFGLPGEFPQLPAQAKQEAIERARRDNLYTAAVSFD